jgi:hypothetical protein
MIIAAAIVGYTLLGLFTARRIFCWRVKHGKHTDYCDKFDTYSHMWVGGLFWFGVPVVLLLWLTGKYGAKILTARPPETNRQKRERKLREKREMQKRISDLERELGVGDG